jgi:hypothetical protein
MLWKLYDVATRWGGRSHGHFHHLGEGVALDYAGAPIIALSSAFILVVGAASFAWKVKGSIDDGAVRKLNGEVRELNARLRKLNLR